MIASIVRRALPLALVAALAGAGNAAAAAIGSSTHISAGTGLFDVTTGPDGNLWATDDFGDAVDRISPDGTVVSYPLATPDSSPFGIASGPDGKVWFTETDTDKIASITTSGAITEFSLAASSYRLRPPAPPMARRSPASSTRTAA